MPDDPVQPPVAHGDRRDEVWIEKDPDQISKVRFTFPVTPPVEEVGVSSREGAALDDAEVTDAAAIPDDPSVWEALEDGEAG